MVLFMKLLCSAWKLSTGFVAAVKNALLTLHSYKSYAYFIEEIDVSNQKVVIRGRGTKTIIKASYADFIGDENLINGVSPTQASIVGGYYGRALRNAMKGNGILKQAKTMDFLLRHRVGRYKVLFQARNGDIGYLDQKSRQEFIEHPLTIVNNNHIISEFDPSEACYIGILAGSSLERVLTSQKDIHTAEKLIQKPPQLRVVK
jgi:hypothetical protein